MYKMVGLLLWICSCLFSTETLFYAVPDRDFAKELIERIETESSSVFLACPRLTDGRLVSALLRAHRRGVRVEVLVDAVSVTKKHHLSRLTEQGAYVFVWQPHHKEHMHHAFCVFGGSTAWMGPAALGRAHSLHRDHVLVVQDRLLAIRCLEEFERMKQLRSIELALYATK